MLKKGFPALFQLGSSRYTPATASEDQALSVPIFVQAILGLLYQTVEKRFSTVC